jgi:hypothetical protein
MFRFHVICVARFDVFTALVLGIPVCVTYDKNFTVRSACFEKLLC